MKERLLAALADYMMLEEKSIDDAEALKAAPPESAAYFWDISMATTIAANRAMKHVFECLAEYIEGLL